MRSRTGVPEATATQNSLGCMPMVGRFTVVVSKLWSRRTSLTVAVPHLC